MHPASSMASFFIMNHTVAANAVEAIKMYSQAIAGDEGDATLFSNRSAAYLAAGLYQEAVLDAQKAATLDPAWAKGFYRLAALSKSLNAGLNLAE